MNVGPLPPHDESICPLDKVSLGEHTQVKTAILDVLTSGSVSSAVAEPFSQLVADSLQNRRVCGFYLMPLLGKAFSDFLVALPAEQKKRENLLDCVEVFNLFPNMFAKLAGDTQVYRDALTVWQFSNSMAEAIPDFIKVLRRWPNR